MNIFKMEFLLSKKARQERKVVRLKRHATKSFYRTLAVAIEKCKQHPRKYYIVQKSEAEWEILGSQEIRKMRKFKEARHDDNFMKLHETSPFVSPENLDRLIYEQSRRNNRWWHTFFGTPYQTVTKRELDTLRRVLLDLKLQDSAWADEFENFVNKHTP